MSKTKEYVDRLISRRDMLKDLYNQSIKIAAEINIMGFIVEAYELNQTNLKLLDRIKDLSKSIQYLKKEEKDG